MTWKHWGLTDMVKVNIEVHFQVEGWHNWEGAPTHRAYLATTHRHLFYVTASVEVRQDDREIEFHDFLDFCKENFKGGQLGGQSCEMMARGLLEKITARFEGRAVIVKVFEDGEVGAVVNYWPN